jgi:hypothetical protein
MSHFMRAMGFCVGWLVTLSGFPQFSQLLGGNDDTDVARPTATVERPSFRGKIEIVGGNGLPLAAYAARLPPYAVSEFAPGVNPFVFGVGDELQVSDVVVLLVAVPVVDAAPNGDGSVMALPFDNVRESQPSVNVAPEVSGCGDVVSVWSLWPWSAFSHSGSITVSQLQDKIPHLSERDAFA